MAAAIVLLRSRTGANLKRSCCTRCRRLGVTVPGGSEHSGSDHEPAPDKLAESEALAKENDRRKCPEQRDEGQNEPGGGRRDPVDRSVVEEERQDAGKYADSYGHEQVGSVCVADAAVSMSRGRCGEGQADRGRAQHLN